MKTGTWTLFFSKTQNQDEMPQPVITLINGTKKKKDRYKKRYNQEKSHTHSQVQLLRFLFTFIRTLPLINFFANAIQMRVF